MFLKQTKKVTRDDKRRTAVVTFGKCVQKRINVNCKPTN